MWSGNYGRNLLLAKKLRVKESQLQECFLLADGGDEYQDTPYRTQVNQRVKVPLDGRADAEPFFFEWTFFTKMRVCIVCYRHR